MVTLNAITVVNKHRIEYNYTCDGDTQKFFNKKESFFVEYNEDISNVPESILIIPFLANFCPIGWFAGFDIAIDCVDERFYNCLVEVRNVFVQNYSQLQNIKSELKVKKIETNRLEGHKSALLFSGGVDAFCSFFRHQNENPDLITIFGADVELDNSKLISEINNFNLSVSSSFGNTTSNIKTNIRTFYTYKVNNLLQSGSWWGQIQHGLSLICSVAPLSYVNRYTKIYIASTRSSHMTFNVWGSMPEIDNKVSWADVTTIHDGYELKRQDKVDLIVENIKLRNETVLLRVCYSELNNGLNCSRCEKCIRTIFAIILAGDDPNKYGFVVDETIYAKIKATIEKGFSTEGTSFFWGEILEKLKSKSSVNYLNSVSEQTEIIEIKDLLQNIITRPILRKKKSNAKNHIINNFPKLFKYYLKLRRK